MLTSFQYYDGQDFHTEAKYTLKDEGRRILTVEVDSKGHYVYANTAKDRGR